MKHIIAIANQKGGVGKQPPQLIFRRHLPPQKEKFC